MEKTMDLKTSVLPPGRFFVGVHKPAFSVRNHRSRDRLAALGMSGEGREVRNSANFPPGDLAAQRGDWVYEIPNPFPFRGVTYIARAWAEQKVHAPESIGLPPRPDVSFTQTMARFAGPACPGQGNAGPAIEALPRPLKLALATTSTDPDDLVCLAKASAVFTDDPQGREPTGLLFEDRPDGRKRPVIHDHALFDAVANNRYLPDRYKKIMALRPGVQGESAIVGEWSRGTGRIYEYLRTNSYIPWGHYAANFADDSVRYDLGDLRPEDMSGLRHLYYQRTFGRVAGQLGLALPASRRPMTEKELETLRLEIVRTLDRPGPSRDMALDGILWGWNFGFDYAPSDYRLHASHQQVHQQYALVPGRVEAIGPENSRPASLPAYACGDLVADFIGRYKKETGHGFFQAYEKAVLENCRMDGRTDLAASLVVHADERVMVFVPKAQTSQWEIQIMPRRPVGNIVEADAAMRRSLDRGIWMAARVLSALGARMVTSIEFSKRIGEKNTDQRLLYSLLPRLPQSPGAFSEAQLRWINGHYPEDFARACRAKLAEATGSTGSA